MKKNKFIVGLTLAALVLGMLQFLPANAAAVTDMVTTSSNQTAGETTILTSTWTTLDAIAAGDVITMTYGAGSTEFDLSTANAVSDLALSVGGAMGVAADCTGSEEFSSSISGQTLVLTACTEFAGVAADSAVSVALADVTNGLSTNSPHDVSFAGTGYTDTGSSTVPVIDSYDVTITATVDPYISFDLDAATTDIESAAPYSVSLGSISKGAAEAPASSNGSTVNSIWVDIDTNADLGAVVTVSSLGNTTLAGLLNTAADPDALIGSSNGDLDSAVTGNGNYGLCVKEVGTPTSGTLARGGAFGSTDCDYTTGNSVNGLATIAQEILNTSNDLIAGGRAEILVKAKASAVAPAGSYTDTLTFTATGTF